MKKKKLTTWVAAMTLMVGGLTSCGSNAPKEEQTFQVPVFR